MITEVPVDLIKPNPNQPRKRFDPDKLQELADSIAEVGLLNPVLVRPSAGGDYEIVHGERRWRACQLAGLTAIRAEVRELDDKTAFLLAFTENLQRDDLDPIEEARALATMLDKLGYTQSQAAKAIGKSQQYIAGRLTLLKLAEPVQELITTRVVNPSVGRELASIPDERWQLTQAKKAARGELTVKELTYSKHVWLNKHDKGEMTKDLSEFLALYPELEFTAEAVLNGQIDFTRERSVNGWFLTIKTTMREFSGQPWHWPKYSGQELLIGPGNWRKDITGLDKWGELPDEPLFTEDEWQEFSHFNELLAIGNGQGYSTDGPIEIPGLPNGLNPIKGWGQTIRWPGNTWQYRIGAKDRRLYDPDYGRFLVETKTPDDPGFIKQGWGCWNVVEFNDGQGKRTRRQFFAHDYIGRTLVENMAETVDPFAFSQRNFGRLKIFKAMPSEMSWWYIRRRTISKDDAIAALEADLQTLKEAQPLSDEEFNKRLLDELQNYIVDPSNISNWREGVQTYPRLPNGNVDGEKANEIYSACFSSLSG